MNAVLLILTSGFLAGCIASCSLQAAVALAGWLLDDASQPANSAAADWSAFKLVLAQRRAAVPQARPRLIALTVPAGAAQRPMASAMMERDAA